MPAENDKSVTLVGTLRKAITYWLGFLPSGGFILSLVIAAPLLVGNRAAADTRECIGDYSTGDFQQWALVHNSAYYGPGEEFVPTYAASIVTDRHRGYAARYEVRAGDVLDSAHGGGERSEVMAGPEARGAEGEVKWYRFATKFDETFPRNHSELGFGFTNQFWGASGAGPPVAWTVGQRSGYWSLLIQTQDRPGVYRQRVSIFDTPIKAGTWHDVVMQVGWSAKDSSGWIKLWLNGTRQQFSDGSRIYRGRTLIPGTRTVHYKEGYYRHQSPGTPTGVVFHSGFRCSADSLLR